ncbi:hypothetical protein INT45_003053 [Circinella minor]|uniref:Rhomboid-type serine protease n=1 Tax=Circinella minor TaxID=1195481 RepID=A0A8H7VFP7_9FUNG|nr:hypothetical protein INT45_003053 [Circinella minor]
MNNNNPSSVLDIPCYQQQQQQNNHPYYIDHTRRTTTPSSSSSLSLSGFNHWERPTKMKTITSDILDHQEEKNRSHSSLSLYTEGIRERGGEGGGNDWYTIFFNTSLAPIKREHEWPVVFTYIMVIFMVAIMSGEFLMNRELSGEFFEFDPFNPMLGPSTQTLIQSGARYIPCMKSTTAMPPDEHYICFNKPYTRPEDGVAGSKDDDNEPEEGEEEEEALKSLISPALTLSNHKIAVRTTCTLQDVCGMGGFLMDKIPDQGFRFITPLFVHSGLIQLGCNMIAHIILASRLECITSSLNLALVFFVSGIFGNLFGANFSPITSQSVGCSSAILGMTACLFVDLILSWKKLVQPIRHLAKIIILTVFCFTLGILPGADNYSDVGGFVSGLLLGIMVVPPVSRMNRKKMICLWMIRFIALGGLISLFIIMSTRFYAADEPDEFCPLCRYISCLPVRGFCDSDDI